MQKLLPLLAAFGSLGCGDPTPASDLPPVAEAAQVLVRPASLRLPSGQSRQLVAQANDAEGSPVGGAEVEFKSLTPGIVKVSPAGLVSALGPSGEAEVSVSSGSATARATIIVTAGEPDSIVLASGGGQKSAVSSILSKPLEVLVADAQSNPVIGLVVEFHPTASGGAVEPSRAVTGPDGIARGLWTLGPRAGRQLVTAQLDKLPDLLLSVAAEAEAGPPTSLTPQAGPEAAISGEPTELVAKVEDALENPVSGVELIWRASSGTLEVASPQTGASGVARAMWLPEAAGSADITVAAAGLPLDVRWQVAVDPGDPVALLPLAGQKQVGRPLARAKRRPSLRVVDGHGNAVPKIAIDFRVAEGGGAIGESTVLTDSEGIATAEEWTFGPAGRQVLEATAAGIAAPLQFIANTGAEKATPAATAQKPASKP